ncbi:Hypothetical protein PHPALM_37269 [Phytophthora palmivora]|uniref:Uncharacterized protein n=1 Tax=Phytophthora palmivora TaxID=4796 RepID=A0A2P4WXW6_9STRA|nr:Hypothetical protein PHPALM_37269 [Phytophthora palmivora]
MAGGVAVIIVCRRYQASGNYSDISVDKNHAPARAVQDASGNSTISRLANFLADLLSQTQVSSTEWSNVLSVARTLLRDSEDDVAMLEQHCDIEVAKVDQFLRDEIERPLLEACKLGNADRRSYVWGMPDDPCPLPDTKKRRPTSISFQIYRVVLLADQLVPSEPGEMQLDHQVDVSDLELVCHLATRILRSSNARISIMGSSHEHELLSHESINHNFNKLDTNQIDVATLCWIGSKPHHEPTSSQYVTMQSLALTMKGLQVQLKVDLNKEKTT